MAKQKAEAADNQNERVLLPHEEPITRDLLFRSQILTDKIIAEVRKRNDEEFGNVEVLDFWAKTNTSHDRPTKSIKSSAVFVDSGVDDTWQYRKKKMFLNAAANKRSGQFYSLSKLVENGVMAESEKDFFDLSPGITDFPYRQINVINRLKKMDGTEWIYTTEQWIGTSATGSVVTCPVMDMMWYIKPKITYEPRTAEGTLLPRGDNISEQITKRAAIIRTTGYLGEIMGEKVYLYPFNEETFRSCLKLARGPVGNANDGCALTLIKEGETNGGTSVKTIEDFLLDFNTIWERQRTPEKVIKFSGDLKSLATGTEVKTNQYQ
jgi:hypothetical protein